MALTQRQKNWTVGGGIAAVLVVIGIMIWHPWSNTKPLPGAMQVTTQTTKKVTTTTTGASAGNAAGGADTSVVPVAKEVGENIDNLKKAVNSLKDELDALKKSGAAKDETDKRRTLDVQKALEELHQDLNKTTLKPLSALTPDEEGAGAGFRQGSA